MRSDEAPSQVQGYEFCMTELRNKSKGINVIQSKGTQWSGMEEPRAGGLAVTQNRTYESM